MSLYQGKLLGVDEKPLGAAIVSLPKSFAIGSPFTVCFLSSRLQNPQAASRFDVVIESALVNDDQSITISASHTNYQFVLTVFEDTLEISVELDVGVLAPCKLSQLTSYADVTAGYVSIYTQKHQARPASEISVISLIVLSAPLPKTAFYMVDLKPFGDLDIHYGTLEEDDEGALYLNSANRHTTLIHGVFHHPYG